MINLKNSFWVFDLDDTLYSELDFETSGYCNLIAHLNILFNRDVSNVIENARLCKEDVLEAICNYLNLPVQTKQSLLWIYRLHIPDITLEASTRSTLEFLNKESNGIAIITDGRSITQRNKLLALNLNWINTYISEEWNEEKPSEKRFIEIQNQNLNTSQFIYVGDNLKKDFVTPNKLGWLSIGIKDKGKNIHKQIASEVSRDYLPHVWINSIHEIKKLTY